MFQTITHVASVTSIGRGRSNHDDAVGGPMVEQVLIGEGAGAGGVAPDENGVAAVVHVDGIVDLAARAGSKCVGRAVDAAAVVGFQLGVAGAGARGTHGGARLGRVDAGRK